MSTILSELELHAVDAALTAAHNLMPGKTTVLDNLTFEQVRRIKQRVTYQNEHGNFDNRYHQYNVKVKHWRDDDTYSIELQKIEVIVKVKNE